MKKGKVIKVDRAKWEVINSAYQNDHNVHGINHSNTYAELESGDKVCISESDILSHYGRKRFTDKLTDTLGEDLCGKDIQYDINNEDEYWLDGSISNYIPKPSKKKK